MTESRSVTDFARQFPENGMKLLLQQPDNLRELLQIARSPLVPLLQLARLEADPTSFVQRDYRHVESDLVLRVPFKRKRRTLLLYILLEHQSDPDLFILFRVLEYVVAILRSQMRSWLLVHADLDGFRFQPVLPIVFYTGLRPWPQLGQLSDLFEDLAGIPELPERLPRIEPLFVNLRDTAADQLTQAGGAFGQVLRLYQARESRHEQFTALVDEVVAALEQLPASGRMRWRELMSYLHALVYHVRSRDEHADLHDRIEQAVRRERRKEVSKMKNTIADMYREEGQLKEARASLLRLLRKRCGELEPGVVSRIESCPSIDQIHSWLDDAALAETLEDVDFDKKE